MSKTTICEGKITLSSKGDTTIHAFDGDIITSAGNKNIWKGGKSTSVGNYEEFEGLAEWIIDSYWTDLKNNKITKAKIGEKVRYHVKTKDLTDSTPLLIKVMEWNKISDTKLKIEGVKIKNNHTYLEIFLDYDWIKYFNEIGEGDELELRCTVSGWKENKKMPAELKVTTLDEIPQLILVNGHWNRFGELLGFSPGTGGKKYWNGFLGGSTMRFVNGSEAHYGITVKNKEPFFFDGSSFAGGTSGGKERKQIGYNKAKELFAHLANKTNKKPICLISHSEGGAYACGVAEYLDSIGYTIKENLLLHCDEADEFDVSTKFPTYQMNAMYFTEGYNVLKKISNAVRFVSHSQQIRKIGKYYAVVDWMVGDYQLKGAKKYGVMIVDYTENRWMNIHTYLVDNNLFEWVSDLKTVKLNDVTGMYNGKVYTGKAQVEEKGKISKRFYRIDNHYIIPNYPKQ